MKIPQPLGISSLQTGMVGSFTFKLYNLLQQIDLPAGFLREKI
jgi:hypothetical protein